MIYNIKMKNNKFQTSTDVAGLAHYLISLAEAVKSGCLPIINYDSEFSLHPRGLVDLTVKVRRKKERGLMTVEMSWSETEPDCPLLNVLRKTT